jgi:hypothetical protein
MQYEMKIAYVIYIQFITVLFMIEPDMGLTRT